MDDNVPKTDLGEAVSDVVLKSTGGRDVSLARESDRGLIIVVPTTAACTACTDEVATVVSVTSTPEWLVPVFALMRGEMPEAVVSKLTTSLPDAVLDEGTDNMMNEQFPDDSTPLIYFVKRRIIVGVGYGAVTAEQIQEKIQLLR